MYVYIHTYIHTKPLSMAVSDGKEGESMEVVIERVKRECVLPIGQALMEKILALIPTLPSLPPPDALIL